MSSPKKPLRFTILAVDDDLRVFDAIRLVFEKDYEVLSAASGEAALALLAKRSIDLVFLDIRMPGGIDGLEVLRKIKESGENLCVVMLTAADTARTAVEAMKLGAFDYLTKPFDTEELRVVAEKALENKRLLREVIFFRSEIKPIAFENLVGRSKAMSAVHELIRKTAATDVTVVIQGESGTGKELVARAIHFAGPRREKPFVAINCAGIPENLLETELFGHEKGAFTGAERQKPGKFELAHEGTIFLDEISSLRLDMQGKILRAVEDCHIERVGGTKTLPVDIRILAATNVDLQKAVKEGKFREDLYYRLQVVPIVLPPLRERREDIPLLLEYFLNIYNKKFGKSLKGITARAMEPLTRYGWPGNIRELENLVERLVVLSDKEIIDVGDLPFEFLLKGRPDWEAAMRQSLILKDARNIFEKEFITAVLERADWNQTEAAKILGIHRNTLILKASELGINRPHEG